MKIIDNVNTILKQEFENEIRFGSTVSIVAAYFSMYAFNELKKNLWDVEEFRFIFSSPTFIEYENNKEKREFFIPKLKRESSIYGTEFEIKLKNELTQKAISKECSDWIRKKARFKSNITNKNIPNFTVIESETNLLYINVDGFTTAELGVEKGNNMATMITQLDSPVAENFINTFYDLWNNKEEIKDITDEIIETFSNAFQENPPELIYYLTLYNVFNEFLEDISEDNLPNEATGFKESKIWNMLYDFQKDGVLSIINKLEQYNGCILADSVGLGKTFTALSVIKYYENRNKNVLVLCPKKLSENWNTYKDNYVNNPIAEDRLNYDVLYHTDLSRASGYSNGLDLSRIRWDNYDLLVIDESHNFRNGEGTHKNTKENRYIKLMNKVIKSGVKTKVLMLSATPVNNKFLDLKNQIALAYEGESEELSSKLNTEKSIEEIFKQAQRAYTTWSELNPEERTTESLQKSLSFDFFELLDSVTIARSRKHIQKYYNANEIGKFPERLKPISIRPKLTDLADAINYNQIYEQLYLLSLCIYTPSEYILKSKLSKYMDEESQNRGFGQYGRETGLKKLMNINLLKRLESSVYSFKLTLDRIRNYIDQTIKNIEDFQENGYSKIIDSIDLTENELDSDDFAPDIFSVGKKMQVDLNDMDYVSWLRGLKADSDILELVSLMVQDITPEHDTKLQTLIDVITEKLEKPINENNRKVLVFTAFADTADYLYENISVYFKKNFSIDSAVISGSKNGNSTIKGLRVDFNNVLTYFSPISKGKELLVPENKDEIDILIATDVISEGQNLQDCDYLINYDIHWNPVRIIQRFGRIDRIGSKNNYIQLVNFWPDMDLDEYINLKNRVETRMKMTVMTSTGDDDLINAEEKGDLDYRRDQLKRLQEEVVDLEDMSSGISIMDLGLNEFRLDLMEYVKTNKNLSKMPTGLHAVVSSTGELPPGVIFVLKNIDDSVNIDNKNRIHPFYMVYLDIEGNVINDYLNPKKILDNLRLLSRDKAQADSNLCKIFNKKTDDGKDMSVISNLLNESINSIVEVKDESDIDSFLSGEEISFKSNDIKGLDNFELICFLVVI